MKNVLIVVGTQQDFIKVAQFRRVADRDFSGKFDIRIADIISPEECANRFFDQFDLTPDFMVDIAQASPNKQIAEVMLQLEPIIEKVQPDLILVAGAANATVAASLSAKKMNFKLAHTESGLRIGDDSMPKEMNRIIADEISDYLFITEESGLKNLSGNGKTEEQFFFVGNTLVDTIITFEDHIHNSPVLQELGLKKKRYVIISLQSSKVITNKNDLKKLLILIQEITAIYKVVLSLHPQIIRLFKDFGMYYQLAQNRNVLLNITERYFAIQKLIANCKFVVTDGTEMQETSTYRRVPCLTLRPSTALLSTIKVGTNTLIPFDLAEIRRMICAIKEGRYKKGAIPDKWDGNATYRILKALDRTL